jgi:hypothetical protein
LKAVAVTVWPTRGASALKETYGGSVASTDTLPPTPVPFASETL